MATPLAVVAELNDPHGDAAQVTLQVTPVPLLTVAVTGVVALVVSDVGSPVRETVGVGVGVGAGELLPPQPEIATANAANGARRMLWRSFIAHLRSRGSEEPTDPESRPCVLFPRRRALCKMLQR